MLAGGKNFTASVLRRFEVCEPFNRRGQRLPAASSLGDACLFKISGGHRWITSVIPLGGGRARVCKTSQRIDGGVFTGLSPTKERTQALHKHFLPLAAEPQTGFSSQGATLALMLFPVV